jgi:hypothetical protein
MTKAEKNKFIKLISKGSLILKDLSEELKSDKDVVAESIKKDWSTFKFASESLKNDVDAIKDFMSINGQVFQFASDKIKINRGLCLLAIKESSNQYQFIKNLDKEDREFIKESVMLAGTSIQFMTENYKDDFEIAKIAVNQSGFAFMYLSKNLKNNSELLIDSVKQLKSGYILDHASDELRTNINLILELLDYVEESLSHWIIKNSHEDIKNNFEIILKAVKISGNSLEFASSELKNSKKIVIEAVLQKYSSIKYASPEILDDLEFISQILDLPKRESNYLEYSILTSGSERVKNNRDLVIKILKRDGNAFLFLIDDFLSDEELVCIAICNVGHASRISEKIIPKNNEFLKYIIALNEQILYGKYENYKTELLTSKERVLTVLNVYYSKYDNKFKNSIPKEFLEEIEILNKINDLELN